MRNPFDVAVCTVTLRQRLPYARVLAESYLAQHPGGRLICLVVDAGVDPLISETNGLELLKADEIGVGKSDLSSMAMLWKPDRLIEAMAPHLIAHLRKDGGIGVLYLADDTKFFSDISEILDLAQKHPLLLSPRVQTPLPKDGWMPDESALREAGIFESGFVGVGPGVSSFLEWWVKALAFDSGPAEDKHPLTTGRALEMAHLFFESQLVGDPGSSVSYWNLAGRIIESSARGTLIDGQPLKFVRFDGYHPDQPHLLSKTAGARPRLLLSERSDLYRLTEQYRDDLLKFGFEEAAKLNYGFQSLPSGIEVDAIMRSVYLDAVRKSMLKGNPMPPDPFSREDPLLFIEWLNSPDPSSRGPLVSRYLLALYEQRLDLHLAFPGIANADVGPFYEWVMHYGLEEAKVPPELARPAEGFLKTREISLSEQGAHDSTESAQPNPSIGADAVTQPGWEGLNIAGYFRAELGVGEMARLLLLGIKEAGVPFATYSYGATDSRQQHPFGPVEDEFTYNINLICVNADQLEMFVRDTGRQILEDRYNIGMWWWEVEQFPSSMAKAASHLDEIWVGSEHVAHAVSSAVDKPVYLVPIPFRSLDARPMVPRALGLSNRFTFLVTFDFLSVFERKNPLGAIEAFKRAFIEDEGPVLVVKSINGENEVSSLEMMRIASQGRSDIKIIDGYLSREDKDGLLAACDCYVSLHRAEGYGLGMAEAMALGKPIIATGYSGNLAFLNEQNSYLIGYELSSVPPGAGPYPEGTKWAEPSIEEAAEAMRHVFERPRRAAAKGRRGRREAKKVHTPKRTALFIKSRMTAIQEQESSASLEGQPPAQ